MLTAIFCFLINCVTLAQAGDSLFSRLSAISQNGTDFYNVDGIEITSQVSPAPFSKKNIVLLFRRYAIRTSDLAASDSLIAGQNYVVERSGEVNPGIRNEISYYFIENENKEIRAITFAAVNKRDKGFEREFISLVMNRKIPDSVYQAAPARTINFAGRTIALDASCEWMGINNVQCPHYGQMNWSVHKTLDDASQSVTSQYNLIKAKKGGKIVSEEAVDIIFEGTPVKAKKAVYDFKGARSVLVGMSGGKTLTLYFVSAPVRGRFVSGVMSFWNNDNISASGLPPLLEQIMQVSK